MPTDDEIADTLVDFVRKEMMTSSAGPDEAFRKVREQFSRLRIALTDDNIRHAEVRLRAELDRITVIRELRPGLNRRNRPQWYFGPRPGDLHWSALHGYLSAQERWRPALQSIDEESTSVVANFDSPALPEFRTIGLVLGHIQSGKTANMTAVIAKAVDAGFRFVLVLTGLTDALRTQTQDRLEKDLIGHHHHRWYQYTTREFDFDMGNVSGFPLPRDQTNIAVVKKNAFVLQRIIDAFGRTSMAILESMPVLLIDDECDQASINSARFREEMKRINGQIRSLIGRLPKVCYVGYTATPFANVLIDPRPAGDRPDDLYPRDFIHPLRRPENYFGPERLFGRELLSHEETSDSEYLGVDMIRTIPDAEKPKLRPAAKAHADFKLEVTETLRRAVLYFLLATAARDSRGQRSEHSSMLVHTSVNTKPHETGRIALQALLADVKKRLASMSEPLLTELQKIWSDELKRVPSGDFGLDPVSFDTLQPYLADVLDSVEVKMENSCSDDRLNYSFVEQNGHKRGRRYVVVGGSVLSRGLTIEGLVASFFLRTASQYDTLMQMGRWFGYRDGYQDLPRIWMDDQMRRNFRSLALVEAEIREDISVYARLGITPLDFAVRIRSIPGMAITARNKMLARQECFVSYDGAHVQTFRFRHEDDTWLRQNWDASATLVNAAVSDGVKVDTSRNHRILRGVGIDRILAFMSVYQVHPDHADLDLPGKMIPFVQERARTNEQIRSWNVVVVGGPEDERLSAEPLGRLGRVPTVIRSRLVEPGDADIKALMSKGDVLIDQTSGASAGRSETWKELIAKREDQRPVLFLYPIDRVSNPVRPRESEGKPTRIPLDAARDVMGLGILFPALNGQGGSLVRYFQAPLPDQDENEDVEDVVAAIVGDGRAAG